MARRHPRTVRGSLLAALALLPLVCAPAAAQYVRTPSARQPTPTLESLRPGDTVRVWAPPMRLDGAVGVVTASGDRTLGLTGLPDGRVLPAGTLVVSLGLTRLEVRRGTRRSRPAVIGGALLGFVGGAVLGGVIGAKLECGASCTDDYEGVGGAFTGILVGGITGATAGGLIAGNSHRIPRWRQVELHAASADSRSSF